MEDDMSAAKVSRWQPATLLSETLGIVEDDHCLVMLNKSRDEWHPMTHWPLSIMPALQTHLRGKKRQRVS